MAGRLAIITGCDGVAAWRGAAVRALALLVVVCGLGSAQASQLDANLAARFEAFVRDFESSRGSLAAPPLGALVAAHDAGRWRDVARWAVPTSAADPDDRNKHIQLVRAFALASSYFWQRAYRSAAEVCVLVADGIQTHAQSAEVRKMGNLCALSVLRAVVDWGQLVDGERDFGPLLRHPGWERSLWRTDPAPLFVAGARFLTRAKSQRTPVPEALAVRYVRSLMVDGSPASGWGDQAQNLPDNAVLLYAASLMATEAMPAESLRLAEPAARDLDPLKGSYAFWLKARVTADLGRTAEASLAFETAAELAVDTIRAETFRAVAEPRRTVLAARLLIDSSRELENNGLAERALVGVTMSTESLGHLVTSTASEFPWLIQLHTTLLGERARLIAKGAPVQSARQRAAVQSGYADALAGLESLAQLPGAQSREDDAAAARIRVARGLGVRGRVLDTLVWSGEWAQQSRVDEVALVASETSLRLAAASADPVQSVGFVWADAAFGYLEDYASAALEFVEGLRAQAAAAGRLDASDDFADQALMRVVRSAAAALRQTQAARSVLDAAPQREVADAVQGRSRLAASVAMLRGQALSSSDDTAQREGLARRADSAAAAAVRLDLNEAYQRASDTLLDTTAELVGAVVRRMGPDQDRTSAVQMERRAAHLCAGMLRAYSVVMTALEDERRWQVRWDESMRQVGRDLAAVAAARQQSLRRLENLLKQDDGVLDQQMKSALALRQAMLAESMIHAHASGLMATQSLSDNLARLRQSVTRAGEVLDSAQQQGGLR